MLVHELGFEVGCLDHVAAHILMVTLDYESTRGYHLLSRLSRSHLDVWHQKERRERMYQLS